MNLSEITPLILTRDEEANIERTLAQLAWADDVVVVDSLSKDATVDIASRFSNTRVLQRELDTLAGQSNYGVWNRLFTSFYDLLAVRWMKKRMLKYVVEEKIN
jgi:hypothetical protein